MVGDDLDQPVRGLEPVEHGVAMTHDAGEGLQRAEPEQRERPDVSERLSRSTIPVWIARPIAKGISA